MPHKVLHIPAFIDRFEHHAAATPTPSACSTARDNLQKHCGLRLQAGCITIISG